MIISACCVAYGLSLDDALVAETRSAGTLTSTKTVTGSGDFTFSFSLSRAGIDYLGSCIGKAANLSLTKTFVSLSSAVPHTVGTASGYSSNSSGIHSMGIFATQDAAGADVVHSGSYYGGSNLINSSNPSASVTAVAVTLSHSNAGTQMWFAMQKTDGSIVEYAPNLNTDLKWADGFGTWTELKANTALLDSVYLFSGVATEAEAKAINKELVPEPSTATLSLLVLAGMAARRRRK